MPFEKEIIFLWRECSAIAVMDDEGFINIVGRIKDMTLHGGENIYPERLKNFFRRMKRLQIGTPERTNIISPF
jgi:acyl-CoA synthetase (AMP-forming)/AMP-acid ligase II